MQHHFQLYKGIKLQRYAVVICAFFLGVISCQPKKEMEPTEAPLNQVAVLVDDKLWNGELGDSLRNWFASPVEGLPQEEPEFTLNQYPIKLFEGYSAQSRNILVIKKTAQSEFKIIEGNHAFSQNTVQVSGHTLSEIIDTLIVHVPEIRQKFRATEIAECQKRLAKNHASTRRPNRKFRVQMNIPPAFEVAFSRKKFLWLKKDIISGSVSLLMYQVPAYKVSRKQPLKNLIQLRDSIGQKYIHGTVSKSRMITESSYTPYFYKTTINGHRAYEIKGNWQMKRNFMEGPFLMYAIQDRVNRRYLIVEGFCYAPSKEKRDIMFELESAMKSLQFLAKK